MLFDVLSVYKLLTCSDFILFYAEMYGVFVLYYKTIIYALIALFVAMLVITITTLYDLNSL